MLATSLPFHSVIREVISLNCNHQRYDFKPFGQAIKSTREKKGLTRKELAAQIRISPRYIASIQNSGQPPSLQVFYRLITCLDMSVDQFFFPEKVIAKTTQRRQLDALLDNISENGLRIITAVAKEIADTEQKNSLK